MDMIGHDSLKTRSTLTAAGKTYTYFSLPAAAKTLGAHVSKLPVSLKILLENVLRFENGASLTLETSWASNTEKREDQWTQLFGVRGFRRVLLWVSSRSSEGEGGTRITCSSRWSWELLKTMKR